MMFPFRFEVVLTPSETLISLKEQVKSLMDELECLKADYNRVELLYRSECVINTELQDLLREHGIPYRDAITQYGK